MSALKTQIAGQHYKSLTIQPVEYIHANSLPFIEGNIVKYITRWREKGGIKDLEKVIHYAQILIELETRDMAPAAKTCASCKFSDFEGRRPCIECNDNYVLWEAKA